MHKSMVVDKLQWNPDVTVIIHPLLIRSTIYNTVVVYRCTRNG